MSLIEALNNSELRSRIEGIDDIWSSLDHGDRSEPTLERLLSAEVFKLRSLGVDYDPRKS